MKKIAKKRGFTLAEVLITLDIIGVVAAITIPILEQNIQDKQFKEAAKAAYSKASQAIQLMKIDNGGILTNYYTTQYSFKPAFMQYFKVAQDCTGSCVPAVDFSTIYTALFNAGKATTYRIGGGQFVTTDGMFWGFQNDGTVGTYANYIFLTVDVNGYGKGPNIFGRDVFMFQLKNDNLIPMGASGTYYSSDAYCKSNGGGFSGYMGFGCMSNVMQGIDY